MNDFTVLDIETTGLRPEGCEITELAAVRVHVGEGDAGKPLKPALTIGGAWTVPKRKRAKTGQEGWLRPSVDRARDAQAKTERRWRGRLKIAMQAV